jgi:pimeloyl-ACP methyl ester carboxylesterase
MRIAVIAGVVLALAAGAARAADKAEIADWWRAYEAAPFAKGPDGRKIRYFCQGKGSPTVILESGLGSGAWTWRTVQPDMAKITRVCSYDRAGYGLSDEAKDGRDVDALAADLAAVAKAAAGGRPVVLVGHSLGGPIVRQFAYRHPKLAAGMVLVDPSGDHQVKRFAAVIPDFVGKQASAYEGSRKCLALTEKGPIPEAAPEYAQCVGPPPPDMPADLVHFHVAYGQSPIHLRALFGEMEGALSEASGKEADAARRPMGAMPLIVLTAGQPNATPGLTTEQRAAMDGVWRAMHWEMTELSTDGRRRFVDGAGHYIQVDKPQAVIGAVAEVVAAVRGR